MIKERDVARAAIARTEHERDAARAERDRYADARHQAEAEVAKLLGELTAAVGGDGARSAAPPTVEASDPTAKGAVH